MVILAKLAAILNFDILQTSIVISVSSIEFVIPKNIYLEVKFVILWHIEVDIAQIFCFDFRMLRGSHFENGRI